MNTPSADGHAVVDERAVLDLDPVAEGDALIDEDVAADDRVAADPGAGPDLGAMPDARPGPDGDVGLDVRRRMDARGRIDHDVNSPGRPSRQTMTEPEYIAACFDIHSARSAPRARSLIRLPGTRGGRRCSIGRGGSPMRRDLPNDVCAT